MKITNIERVNYSKPVKVYDVINANPYNNFLIKTNDNNFVVSHNCALM